MPKSPLPTPTPLKKTQLSQQQGGGQMAVKTTTKQPAHSQVGQVFPKPKKPLVPQKLSAPPQPVGQQAKSISPTMPTGGKSSNQLPPPTKTKQVISPPTSVPSRLIGSKPREIPVSGKAPPSTPKQNISSSKAVITPQLTKVQPASGNKVSGISQKVKSESTEIQQKDPISTKVPVGLSQDAPGGTAPPPPSLPSKPIGVRDKTGTITKPGEKNGSPLSRLTGKFSKKSVIFLLGGVTVVLLLIMILSRVFGGGGTQPADTSSSAGGSSTNSPSKSSGGSTSDSSKQVVLTYWGLWEPSEVLAEIISDFEDEHAGIKIDYRKQSHRDYRERLQTSIVSGNGPDLFRFHASWTPMLKEELAVLPSKVMSSAEYKSIFYSVAADQLQVESQIVGIPLMYDGLALFYNKEILRTAGEDPPTTWAKLREVADSLTVPSDRNARTETNIQRAGLAIGNASNVEHFSDILALLILQNGGDPATPNYTEVRDALVFYTNFITVDKVWSPTLPNSTVAFARGDAAMVLAPSWRAHEIMNINPSLDFGVAPVPQLGDETITWASYWAEGVNSKGKNQDEAWEFIKYLSGSDVMKKLYSQASLTRAFGEPYSRKDLASELESDPLVGAYLLDAPSAQGWYLSSSTHDSGINDQMIKYYEDAVNAVLDGKQVEEVLKTLDLGVKQVLRQYSVE